MKLNLILPVAVGLLISHVPEAECEDFTTRVHGKTVDYELKKVNTDTVTTILIRQEWVIISYSNKKCGMSDDETSVLTRSALEIVDHFNLRESIKKSTSVDIANISCIENKSLLSAINKNEQWPQNYVLEYKKKFPNSLARHKKYDSAIKELVMQDKMYLALIAYFRSFGCSLSLDEYSFDYKNLDEDFYTKEELIKSYAFKGEELNKEVYPALLGRISFSNRCTNKNAAF